MPRNRKTRRMTTSAAPRASIVTPSSDLVPRIVAGGNRRRLACKLPEEEGEKLQPEHRHANQNNCLRNPEGHLCDRTADPIAHPAPLYVQPVVLDQEAGDRESGDRTESVEHSSRATTQALDEETNPDQAAMLERIAKGQEGASGNLVSYKLVQYIGRRGKEHAEDDLIKD